MPDSIQIYDSTLRDGAQAQDISFSVEDKLMIASRLDNLKVHYIEGGWPNPTNPKDLDFFTQARKISYQNARIVAFGSTRRNINRPENDPTLNTLLQAQTETITIFGKSWSLHVHDVLRISLAENLQLIQDSVDYLKNHGKEVIYDAEHFFDGYKANPTYALKTILAAQKGGAEILILCDTNGGALPMEIHQIISEIKPKISIPFGIHAHNDTGMGIANSIIAVELGALQVQGTINGLGERCGNANLCSVIPNLEIKLGKECIGPDNLKKLMDFSRFVSEVANVYHDHRQPYVGESAFAHKGGVHIDAMIKQPLSYEHSDPSQVGNQRRYLLSEQSGGATIATKFEHLIPNINKEHPAVHNLLKQIKKLEHEGYVFEAADASVEILARKALGSYRDPFRLIGFRTINRKFPEGTEVEAIVKLEVKGNVYHTVAEGDGPINALDAALRQALEQVYPNLKEVHLEDYKVRVLSSQNGTAAKVRVLIESSDREDTWSTTGVSENIIDASWLALVDSFSYKLLKDGTVISKSSEDILSTKIAL